LSELTPEAAERTRKRFEDKIDTTVSPETIEYLESLVGKIALMPDDEVRRVIDFNKCKECHLPHIRPPDPPHTLREKVHTHVYASNCIIQAINKHRNSPDRGRKGYRQGKDYSEHLYFYFISAEANRDLSFYPVSMTDNSMHNGFFKTLLPVEVIDVYKLIFDADDIKDARFEKITF
jgi:DNA-directed RNA polymerase subunit H (RpoH/RPB5)